MSLFVLGKESVECLLSLLGRFRLQGAVRGE